MRGARRAGGHSGARGGRTGDARGLSLVELAVVLIVLAIVGSILWAYLGSATRTIEKVQEERPLAQARLTADRATLTSMRTALNLYYGQNGKWPADKEAVAALLNPSPNFQCAGNDFTYDPATGQVDLLIDDASRC